MEIAKYSSKIIDKTPLTPDVFACRFEKPAGFEYLAGQFVQLLIEDGDKIKALAYSLSSIPTDPYLEFCVKIHEDGKGCQCMLHMDESGTIDFQGPRGMFVHTKNGTALSFIATGTGIAPILGIIRDELENKRNSSEIRLLFGVRNEEDRFWVERLESLTTQFQNFSYQITLSQPKEINEWSGLRGRVTEHILHHLVSHKFYLCGSAGMVKDVRTMLIQNGIEPTNIHFEIF